MACSRRHEGRQPPPVRQACRLKYTLYIRSNIYKKQHKLRSHGSKGTPESTEHTDGQADLRPMSCTNNAIRNCSRPMQELAHVNKFVWAPLRTLLFHGIFANLNYDSCLLFFRHLHSNRLTTVDSGVFGNLSSLIALWVRHSCFVACSNDTLYRQAVDIWSTAFEGFRAKITNQSWPNSSVRRWCRYVVEMTPTRDDVPLLCKRRKSRNVELLCVCRSDDVFVWWKQVDARKRHRYPRCWRVSRSDFSPSLVSVLSCARISSPSSRISLHIKSYPFPPCRSGYRTRIFLAENNRYVYFRDRRLMRVRLPLSSETRFYGSYLQFARDPYSIL